MTTKPQQALEKRSGTDRRQWECTHQFPYVDTHGYLVTVERRKASDRRHSCVQKQ